MSSPKSGASAIAMQLDYIRTTIGRNPTLKKYADLAEEHTKVNYEYIVVGILAIMALMLFTGYGAEFIVHLFAFVWPFYKTIGVLEAGNKAEYADWLIYWVVYGFLGIIDSFADYIMYWVPFFSPLKLVFLVWCWYPTTKGSNVIYYSFIQPLYKEHGSHIDTALNNMFDPKSVINAAKTASSASKRVSEEDLSEKKED